MSRTIGHLSDIHFGAVDDSLLDPLVSAMAVTGTNPARSVTWKGGRVDLRQIARVKEKLCGLDHRVVKIVVTHHPFDLPHGFTESHLVGGARMAMAHLAECGADLLLAG